MLPSPAGASLATARRATSDHPPEPGTGISPFALLDTLVGAPVKPSEKPFLPEKSTVSFFGLHHSTPLRGYREGEGSE